MKRAFSMNPNTNENPFLRTPSGHKKTNSQQMRSGLLTDVHLSTDTMKEKSPKSRMNLKQGTYSKHKVYQVYVPGDSTLRKIFDFTGLPVQKSKSYLFIVDWQL